MNDNELSDDMKSLIEIIDFKKMNIIYDNIDSILNDFRDFFQDDFIELSIDEIDYLNKKYYWFKSKGVQEWSE